MINVQVVSGSQAFIERLLYSKKLQVYAKKQPSLEIYSPMHSSL